MESPTSVVSRTTGLLLTIVRQSVAPAAAVIYLVLWIVAESGRWHLAQSVTMFALFAVAIGVSVRFPRVALGLVVAIGLLQALSVVVPPEATTWPSSAGAGFVIFFVAAFGQRAVKWLALIAAVVASLTFGLVAGLPTTTWPDKWGSWIGYPGHGSEDAVLLAGAALALSLTAWALGFGVGLILTIVRRDLAETETTLVRTDLDLRLSEDRARISRDVHDALAHSLAVIVSQAQGAGALADQRPEVVREALATVADVARTALVDVRMLVERIVSDEGAVPRVGLAGIPGLVESMRGLGMRIRLTVDGVESVALTESQETAVFRILQESLTNALKHAGSEAVVVVSIVGAAPGLSLEVSSAGERPLVTKAGVGVGIAGMAERARLAGGWLRAEPVVVGDASGRRRFVVTAFIPASLVGGSLPSTDVELASADA